MYVHKHVNISVCIRDTTYFQSLQIEASKYTTSVPDLTTQILVTILIGKNKRTYCNIKLESLQFPGHPRTNCLRVRAALPGNDASPCVRRLLQVPELA